MSEAALRHTAELAASERIAIGELLSAAFDDFGAEDMRHALGGLHALVWEREELVAHGALVQRQLLHRGRSLRAGYVEAVAVHPEHRGRGHSTAVMRRLEAAIAAAYELGALHAEHGVAPLYVRRGWIPWQGRTLAMGPEGLARTAAADGRVLVLPGTVPLSLCDEIACGWRDGDLW